MSARLYGELPSWYRARDADAGLDENGRAPIEAFVARMEAGFDALHAAIGTSYDDWFVETCAPALLPALGTLVGLELRGPALPGDRRLVADALSRWRSKGSAWALQDALTAACGWPVELREFENTLLATRAVGHPRSETLHDRAPVYGAGTTSGPNLRRVQVRVRRGFGVRVEAADPHVLGNGWYAFDPGGLLRPAHPARHGVRVRAAGEERALGRPSLEQSSDWEMGSDLEPSGSVALLDAPRGRFWLPLELRQQVRVDRVYWRPGPIGAGLPDVSLTPPADAWRASVSRDFGPGELGDQRRCFPSIGAALAAWPRDRDADVRILDSGTYGALGADVPPGLTLTVHAHPGEMPCLTDVHGSGRIALGGLLLTGRLRVNGDVHLASCNVRGASVIGGGRVERSVMGPITIAGRGELRVFDSVLGHAAAQGMRSPPSLSARPRSGGSLLAERSTFLGRVTIGVVTRAHDCLFRAPVHVERPHPGRFEHSPYPAGSRTGDGDDAHAYQPSEAPIFESCSPDAPGYACLLGPAWITRAASDGGEPGAFHGLHVGARMARLDQMLTRFLPAGFSASVEVVHEGSDG